MERRLVLAIALAMLVLIVPSVLWPPKPTARRPDGRTDSSAVTDTSTSRLTAEPSSLGAAGPSPQAAEPPSVEDTVWVESDLYRFGFSTVGGRLVAAELSQYKSFAPGDTGRVQLVPEGRPLLEHRLVAGGDTANLAEWAFVPSESRVRVDGVERLTFTADRGSARVELEYSFAGGDYRIGVRGTVTGVIPGGAVLLLGMGDGLRHVEGDLSGDAREYKVVTKAARTESRVFGSIDPDERVVLDGPFEWVAVKSKYFLAAALAISEGGQPFGGAIAVGGPRQPRTPATRAAVTLTQPVTGGTFAYQLYAGPIDHRRLKAIGHDLDDVNPDGGFLRPIIKPVTVGVVSFMLWMHERLGMQYGWVLVVFGVLVRVVLWPLNQKAMESGMRMQAVAPILKDVQERYKNDPEKMQRETMRIYREYKVNPFGGCLPMLAPLPVLFAMFFVFTNAIEFRGVPFLWLPDLARHDPTYIIVALMGMSMYAVTRIGMIGVPPNPQSKMMLYVLPAMMVFFFFRFASGLNLYYTVQNLFSIPQQYLIARKRLRQAGTVPQPVPR